MVQESTAIIQARERLAARLAEAEALALTPEQTELAAIAKEEEAAAHLADENLKKRLELEADQALSLAREKHRGKPLAAMVSVNAHKLCGIGWLVVGNPDSGHAINALREAGNYDVKRGGLKILEQDVNVMLPQVQLAIIASPKGDAAQRHAETGRALTDAPHFVLAVYRRIEQLGGSDAEDIAGKSKR